jgi:hypothetical protein
VNDTAKRGLTLLAFYAALFAILAAGEVAAAHRPHTFSTQTDSPAQIEQWRHAYELEQAEAALSASHHCHPVSWWVVAVRAHAYPATMLVQPVTAGVYASTVKVEPWHFGTIDGKVLSLCWQ